MKKATAVAPANIALIKYWGKRDARLNLPLNPSLSMNLSELQTTTTVEFGVFPRDKVFLNGKPAPKDTSARVIEHLKLIRKLRGVTTRARVETKNTFPSGVGIASSASGYAALTLAAVAALRLRLSERELSALARRGSGSACRSIPDGFVEWVAGKTDASSYARSIYPPKYWDVRDVVVLVSMREKRVCSREGHAMARTSPYLSSRLHHLPLRIRRLKAGLRTKDFVRFGVVIEEEALDLQAIMITSRPPLLYLESATISVIQTVWDLRNKGIGAYFTLDAGPTAHVICQGKDADFVADRLRQVPGVIDVVVNKPACGARVIKKHLY